MRRQHFLSAVLLLAGSLAVAKIKVIYGGMPWVNRPASLPEPVDPAEGWKFLTADEASAIEAIADRLIPSDELSVGGKEAGCAVFIDRQRAGDYGAAVTQYRLGPFREGTPQQGPQFQGTPAQRYRKGFSAFDRASREQHGKGFAALAQQQDELLVRLKTSALPLHGIDGGAVFDLLLQNVREAFFADPIYGGNRDMVG